MRFVTAQHSKPDPVFWMRQRSNLPMAQHVAQVARLMDARLRGTVPPQWVPALDIIMPPKPTVRAVGGDWLSWNLARVDAMRDFEHAHKDILHWAVDDHEVCARAKRCADTVDDLLNGHSMPMSRQDRLDTVLDYCERIGVEVPNALTSDGLVARAVTEQWWRRALRRKVARTVEHAAIKLGVVHHRNGGYASDEACRRRVDQNQRNAALLKKTKMRNEAGQVYSLAELAAVSPSNRDIRRGELMTRIRGCEEYADAQGHHGVFLTLTCPSRYHAVLSGGRSRWARPTKNNKFEGDSPRDAQKWLCGMWAKARAKMARKGVQGYGFRVAEPHHDGCPHWHALLWFTSAEQAKLAQQIISGYWLSDAGDEPGAVRNRCKFIAMTRGGAAGYVAKYVAKNIGAEDGGDAGVGQHTDTVDGFEHVMDTREFKGWQRVDAWASTWGIRQFQAIGQPSVTVWREMRRVTQDQIDAIRRTLDGSTETLRQRFRHKTSEEFEQIRLQFGERPAVAAWFAVHKVGGIQASWERYVRAQGGMCKKRREWALRTAVRATECSKNGFGETITKKVTVGVETRSGKWLISRRQAWKPCAGEAEQDKAQRAALGRPWTRFNNCTARLTREPLRQLMHGDNPWPNDHDSALILPPEPFKTTKRHLGWDDDTDRDDDEGPLRHRRAPAPNAGTFDPGIAVAAQQIREADARWQREREALARLNPGAFAPAAAPVPADVPGRVPTDPRPPEFAAFAARVKAGAARLRAAGH
ncbi:replication protein A [Xenophilus aerolatus]|nr:replication protein A [Xenophilus aerolatus]